jgi:thymidylate synthase (FAD)
MRFYKDPDVHHHKVLDHGFVKYVDHMGSEESIIEAARMSTAKGFVGWDADASLLEYLYKNKHMTPFEMCELVVDVKAPIFVFRELHRHRTFSINEMSGRYVQMPNEHYIPEVVRAQSSTNKQGSAGECNGLLSYRTRRSLAVEQAFVYDSYEEMIKAGVAKEQARLNTPVSRYSVMRWKTDLRNWLQMLTLRDHDAAQWECRQFAIACGSIIKEIWPRTYGLWEEYTKFAKTLSRSELVKRGIT